MTNKSYWTKIVEFIVRRCVRRQGPNAPALPPRPAADPAHNDIVLTNLADSDPTYRAFMDYCYEHIENQLAVAMDPKRSLEDQRDFKNRAAGVIALISDIEVTRAELKTRQAAEQRRDAARARRKAAGAAAGHPQEPFD